MPCSGKRIFRLDLLDIFRSAAVFFSPQSYNDSSGSPATHTGRATTPLKNKWNALFALPHVGAGRTAILAWSAAAITTIALIDRYFDENISFGFLYLFPMLMMGAWLRPWQLALVAALCTALTEAFDPFPWAIPVGLSRMVLTFAACFGAGFYRYAAARDKRAADRRLHDVEQEAARRLKAEEQLEFLISSSPAPIFTLDAAGKVLLANGAAHRLLRVGEKTLEGQDIVRYFPALGTIPSSQQAPFFHTE